MPQGPGKYDDIATAAREQTDAKCIVLVVLGGNRGNGFSVQATADVHPDDLVTVLRKVADQIEHDTKATRS